MTELITCIIKYLLKHHYDKYPDCKYLMIEVNDHNKYEDGNIQINATGSWVRNFRVSYFTAQWQNFTNKICIHSKIWDIKQYEVYKVNEKILLYLEEEPFVENCEYYISFVFKISTKLLKNKFSMIKKYVKAIADRYTDIKIKLVASDQYWQEDEKVNKCLKLINESITTILIYDTTNKFKEVVEENLGVSSVNAVSEKLDNLLPQLLYQYNEGFDI